MAETSKAEAAIKSPQRETLSIGETTLPIGHSLSKIVADTAASSGNAATKADEGSTPGAPTLLAAAIQRLESVQGEQDSVDLVVEESGKKKEVPRKRVISIDAGEELTGFPSIKKEAHGLCSVQQLSLIHI